MRMFIPKVNDNKYLSWVRTLPCAFCGRPGPSEPHHIRNLDGPTGGGTRPSDHFALPACHGCHQKDQQYTLNYLIPRKQFMALLIIKHLSEYISYQKNNRRQ